MVILSRFAGRCSDCPSMRRTRTVPGQCALLVVFTTPQAVLSTIAASCCAFDSDGATGAVGAGQGFAAVSTAVSFTGRGKEDMGFAFAHGSFVPARLAEVHSGFGHWDAQRAVLQISHTLNLALNNRNATSFSTKDAKGRLSPSQNAVDDAILARCVGGTP